MRSRSTGVSSDHRNNSPSPYAIAGVNVIAADTDDEAQQQWETVRRYRIARFVAPGRDLTDDEADAIIASPQGQQVVQMMHYSAIGEPD